MLCWIPFDGVIGRQLQQSLVLIVVAEGGMFNAQCLKLMKNKLNKIKVKKTDEPKKSEKQSWNVCSRIIVILVWCALGTIP